MNHAGILAQNVDGAAQCFVTYCREGARRLGGHTYPDVSLDYIAFGHTLAAARDGHAAVRQLVGRSVAQLRGAGADFFVCADNTAHLALDLPGPDLDLPGLHLVELVTEEAASRAFTKVGILGTGMLVSSLLYPTWFATRGIRVDRPDDAQLAELDRLIGTELVNGITTTQARRRCLDIMDGFAEAGCDAVALVSTELPYLMAGTPMPLPVLDSADIAARATIDVALGARPMPTWRGGRHPNLPTGL